ncbi:MAG: hypothetical protein JW953_15925 [Anaerolineae bacterium]|nr:hypothetical protein [Anaerolineae bacterium]
MNYRLYLRQYGGAGLLLIIYIILSLAYNYAIPFSKGPDEYINYQYILFIAKHHRLPATIAERQEAGVKADWQPFYHLVGGLIAAPISLTPPPELKVTWEPPTRQLIDIVLPRATLIRTEDEQPPYRGVYAVWQTGRWVSMGLGAGALIVTYLICLTLWPNRSILATGSTALLVFIPRFLFTHAVLSDDTMLGFCLALYLLLLIRIVKTTYPSLLLFAGLGLTAGLAIVTKYTAIPVVGGALITGGWVAYKKCWPWPDTMRRGVVFVGTLLVVVGGLVGWVWWHFNQVSTLGLVMGLVKPLLPGAAVDDNPTTSRLTALLSGQSVAELGQAPGAGGSFLDWARNTFVTFWSVTVFGAEPGWPYPHNFILIVLALCCGVVLIGLWRVYRRAQAEEKILWLALVIQILAFFPLPLLRFALSRRLNDAAQGRHLLFPAGPAIAILLMAGWLAWFKPQWRHRVALAAGGLMLVWGVGHLGYLWQAYPPPLPVRTTSGPQMQVEQSTHINFGDSLLLAGYQTHLSANGSILQIDLLWQSLAQADEDYRTEITLVDHQGQPQLRWLSHPANGRFPTRAWQPGDLVRDTLPIPVVGLPPDDYKVQLRLLGWNNPLESGQGEMVSLTSVTLENITQLTPPILWQQAEVYAFSSAPFTYRYHSTIPVTLAESDNVSLIGPDGQPRLPAGDIGHLRIFMVDHDWPSGNYRLQINGVESDLALRVENFDIAQNGWNFTPPPMMYPVQANFADKIELLGYDLPTRRVEAGGGIPLVLYWRGFTQMREDYTIFVQLLDANLERRGGYDRLPRETYNTYLWVPGEVVDDGFAVPVEADAPDGVYTIRVGLYRQEDGQSESLSLMQDGQSQAETSVVIGPLKVGGPPAGVVAPDISPQHPLDVDLGETIAVRGYDLNQTDTAIHLKLYWQSFTPTDIDYTVFVHLQSEVGEMVAQVDGPPAAGQYPTSLWNPGEIIPDAFTLNLPPEIELETYHLVIGLYDPLTGTRLSVPDAMDNSLLLTEINLD